MQSRRPPAFCGSSSAIAAPSFCGSQPAQAWLPKSGRCVLASGRANRPCACALRCVAGAPGRPAGLPGNAGRLTSRPACRPAASAARSRARTTTARTRTRAATSRAQAQGLRARIGRRGSGWLRTRWRGHGRPRPRPRPRRALPIARAFRRRDDGANGAKGECFGERLGWERQPSETGIKKAFECNPLKAEWRILSSAVTSGKSQSERRKRIDRVRYALARRQKVSGYHLFFCF